MSDEDKSIWEKLAGQISSPWDWFAIGCGAALGSGFTVLTHGADLGSSIATGATAGLTARKALVASLQRRTLGRSARSLRLLIGKLEHQQKESLLRQLDTEIDLWTAKVRSDAEFRKEMVKLADKYTEYRNTTQNRMNIEQPVGADESNPAALKHDLGPIKPPIIPKSN